MKEFPGNKLLDIVDFLKEHDDIISTKTLFSLADDLHLSRDEMTALVSESAW